MAAVSGTLHTIILALLLVSIERKPQPETQDTPEAVSIVFEGGAKEPASQSNPAKDQTEPAKPNPATEAEAPPAPPPPAPDSPPTPPVAEAPPTPPTLPPPETPPARETPPQTAETKPQDEAKPQQQAMEQAPPPPEPPQAEPEQPPPPQTEPVPMPPAPPRVELVLPQPRLAPPPAFQLPELPPAPPRPPLPRPRIAQVHPRAAPKSEFTPMFRNYALGGQHTPSTLQGLGPNVAGPERIASNVRGAETLGPDWINMMLAWVEQHKYYPETAAMNGEDGSPTVEVTVNRNGRVQAVELVDRSGSRWLDIALTALFRNAQLPPFPDNAKKDQVTFDFTMHYILVGR